MPAGAPVVSLLPPGNIKVRFFVPKPRLGDAAASARRVRVACDGCAARSTRRVTFISPQAEYTPPVIYSRENRAKLVFLVEARPTAEDAREAASRAAGRRELASRHVWHEALTRMTATDLVIDVRGLTKSFGGRAVVDDFAHAASRAGRSAASSAPTAAARRRPSACSAAC